MGKNGRLIVQQFVVTFLFETKVKYLFKRDVTRVQKTTSGEVQGFPDDSIYSSRRLMGSRIIESELRSNIAVPTKYELLSVD